MFMYPRALDHGGPDNLARPPGGGLEECRHPPILAAGHGALLLAKASNHAGWRGDCARSGTSGGSAGPKCRRCFLLRREIALRSKSLLPDAG